MAIFNFRRATINPVAILMGAVGGAIETVLGSDDIPVPNAEVPTIRREVEARVEKIVRNEVAPQIEHLANAEPWYRSRVTLGAIISSVCAAIAIFTGTAIGAEDQALAVEIIAGVGVLAGNAFTAYGRWVAKKPIGR